MYRLIGLLITACFFLSLHPVTELSRGGKDVSEPKEFDVLSVYYDRVVLRNKRAEGGSRRKRESAKSVNRLEDYDDGGNDGRQRLEDFIDKGYNRNIEVTIEILSNDEESAPNELPIGPLGDSSAAGNKKDHSESSEDASRDDAIFGLVDMTTDWHITQPSSNEEGEEEDGCEVWMKCKSEELMFYLSQLDQLPSCPCHYPATLASNGGIWDPQKKIAFQWNDVSNPQNRLDVFKPTAKNCIRSKLLQHTNLLAAQNCCYDEDKKLITRGPGAGTPALISPEISYELHYRIDIMPWIMCKGDWTRYNAVRRPNNFQECLENPDQATFLELAHQAKLY